jgi:hypothetical protein
MADRIAPLAPARRTQLETLGYSLVEDRGGGMGLYRKVDPEPNPGEALEIAPLEINLEDESEQEE